MQETTGRLIGSAVSFFLMAKDNAIYVGLLHDFLRKTPQSLPLQGKHVHFNMYAYVYSYLSVQQLAQYHALCNITSQIPSTSSSARSLYKGRVSTLSDILSATGVSLGSKCPS